MKPMITFYNRTETKCQKMDKAQNHMKNIRKLLAIFIFISLSYETFSQNIGVKAGLNLSTTHFKNHNYNVKLNPGIHIGVTAELPINEIFAFNPELLFTSKGVIYDPKEVDLGGDLKIDQKEKDNIYYLEIPLILKSTLNIKKNKIYLALGPYLSIGLFGNEVNETKSNIPTFNSYSKTKISWGGEYFPTYNRFDYGITGGAGIEIKAIRFGLSYDLGLAPINETKVTNRVIGISVGYKFSSK